jgi:hypothetical protein
MPLGALILVAAFCAHAAEPWKRENFKDSAANDAPKIPNLGT